MPHESRSSSREIAAYLGRVSGPLLDRIDIHIEVPPVPFQQLAKAPTGEDSATIRNRVMQARQVQQRRYQAKPAMTCNARMGSRELKQHATLDEAAMALLKAAMTEMNLSARAYDRILKVARTIADLAGSRHLAPDHVGEAIQFRSLDRQIWT